MQSSKTFYLFFIYLFTYWNQIDPFIYLFLYIYSCIYLFEWNRIDHFISLLIFYLFYLFLFYFIYLHSWAHLFIKWNLRNTFIYLFV